MQSPPGSSPYRRAKYWHTPVWPVCVCYRRTKSLEDALWPFHYSPAFLPQAQALFLHPGSLDIWQKAPLLPPTSLAKDRYRRAALPHPHTRARGSDTLLESLSPHPNRPLLPELCRDKIECRHRPAGMCSAFDKSQSPGAVLSPPEPSERRFHAAPLKSLARKELI